MLSKDQEILIEMIEPPYYRGTFTNVPMDPFGIVLFGKLGKINQDLYDEGLRDFKSKLTPEFIEKFAVKELKKISADIVDVILEMIQEEYSSNLKIYHFLYNAFGLSYKIYNEFGSYIITNNYDREVYLFRKDNRYHPMLRQEIDGVIRIRNEFL